MELIKPFCLNDGIVKADLCETVRLEKSVSRVVTDVY